MVTTLSRCANKLAVPPVRAAPLFRLVIATASSVKSPATDKVAPGVAPSEAIDPPRKLTFEAKIKGLVLPAVADVAEVERAKTFDVKLAPLMLVFAAVALKAKSLNGSPLATPVILWPADKMTVLPSSDAAPAMSKPNVPPLLIANVSALFFGTATR